MYKLTDAILVYIKDQTKENLFKVFKVIEDMFEDDDVIAVPSYYFGEKGGYQFSEIAVEDKKFLVLLSDKEQENQFAPMLLGVKIRQVFARYFESGYFFGIVFNPLSDSQLIILNDGIDSLVFSKDLKEKIEKLKNQNNINKN